MADEGRKRLEIVLADLLDLKANKPILVPALVGAFVNGAKTITVNERQDFIFIRLRGNTSEPTRAFNGEAGVGHHFDLPILVFRSEENPEIWTVKGRDIRVYQDWDGVSYLPRHGFTHSFGSSGSVGSDVSWVYKRQYMPLMPRPQASGTMSLFVERGYWFCGDTYNYWGGSGTVDFTASKPTGSANLRYMTIYLDCATEQLRYVTGTETTTALENADPGSGIALPPLGAGATLAAVLLTTGTERLTWFDIVDLRIIDSVEPTGSAGLLNFFDEGSSIGQANTINIVGNDVEVQISGSVAHIVHEDVAGSVTGSFVLLDEGVAQGIVSQLDFVGAGVTAVESGEVGTVTVPGGGGGGLVSGSVLWQDWRDWTPVWSAATAVPNNTGTYAKYWHMGTFVHVVAHIFSSGTSSGGIFEVSGLPILPAANALISVRGQGRFFDEGTAFRDMHVKGVTASPDTVRFNAINVFADYSDAIDADDRLWFELTYQGEAFQDTIISGS